ncbi:MAG: peptide deformylase [Deltaproteobacteria bacterium]|nr:peptide deformylase [Deltaproteobacteria bacterium]
MAILKVARMGHPILRREAAPVTEKEIKSAELQQFIDDMIETMHEYDGLGLAAPQVHRPIRLSVVEVQDNPRYPNKEHVGLHVFINPVLTILNKATNSYWEGCLSVPGLRGLVARPNKIKVKYLDRDGKAAEFIAENFLSTVLQHEFDHLDGKLYIDRLVDSTKLVFEQEFERYWLPNAEDTELDD